MHRAVGGVLAVPVLAFLAATSVAGQLASSPEEDRSPRLIPRIDGRVLLDGRIDEPVWADAERFAPVVHVPNFGAAPSERTEFRMAHDGEYLYFACLSYDSEPDLIRAASLRRDETGFTSDRCAILLDTANDEQNAVAFYTSPAGVRSDYTYSGDGAAVNSNWDSFWDVAASQDEHGWYGEFRIPLSTLVFEPQNGRVVMGVAMLRNIARRNEKIVYPAISPSWERGWGKASLMRKVELQSVKQRNPVYLTPYVFGGGGYARTPAVGGAGYVRETDMVREVGIDVRYGVTSNLTLDLTANTDFAQVEADDQQVNLTRFTHFFPEKRRFFQERASTFEYSLGGQERLFHSRRVGLAQGKPVRILGGGRLVGRVGEWDIGALSMQTAELDSLPSENQTVVRVRRSVVNPHSYAGGILTSRLGSDGSHNLVYGFDALVRVLGQDYLTLDLAQSFDDREDPTGGGDVFDRALVRLNWERRGLDGFTYVLDVIRAGRAFEPRLGFLLRRDYAKADALLSYGWRPGASSPLLRYALHLNGAVFRRNEDGTVETALVQPGAVVETKSGHSLTLNTPISHEQLREEFFLPQGGVYIPAGTHRFAVAMLDYRAPQSAVFKPNAVLQGGQYFDGRQISGALQPSWSPSRHLTLGGTLRIDHVEFPDREGFTAQIAGLRTEIMLSTAISFLSFLQYNSITEAVSSNFRLRYNPREGNDLYVVWNEGLLTERYPLESSSAISTDRKILVKYAHTFQLGL